MEADAIAEREEIQRKKEEDMKQIEKEREELGATWGMGESFRVPITVAVCSLFLPPSFFPSLPPSLSSHG